MYGLRPTKQSHDWFTSVDEQQIAGRLTERHGDIFAVMRIVDNSMYCNQVSQCCASIRYILAPGLYKTSVIVQTDAL